MTDSPEYDLLTAIYEEHKKLKLMRPCFKWIRGHQDIDSAAPEERVGVEINTAVDHACGEYMDEHSSSQCALFFPSSRAALRTGQTIVHTQIQNTLYMRLQGKPLLKHIAVKNSWTNGEEKLVNWEAHGKALRALPMEARPTTHKAIHGWLYTGHWQARVDNTSSNCPLCQHEETNQHLLTCTATSDEREVALLAFKTELGNIFTASAIKQWIVQRLTQTLALTDEHPEVPIYLNTAIRFDELLQTAAMEQAEVNWTQFLKGRHVTTWARAQEAYFHMYPDSRPTKHYTGERWATKAIGATLELYRNIWYTRNLKVHSSTADEPSTRIRNLHDRVRDYYQRQYDLFPLQDDRDTFFAQPLEHRLKTRPFQLVKWMETIDILHQHRLPLDIRPAKIQTTLYRYFNFVRPPEPFDPPSDAGENT